MTSEELAKRYQLKDLKTFEYNRQLWEARFSPCGQYLVAGGYDATVQRWKVTDGGLDPLPPLTGHNGWVQCLDFVADGERVISADSWGRLSCWKYSDPESPQPLWSRADALAGWIRALDVSSDGTLVAIGGNDQVVRLLATADGSTVKEFPVPDEVFSLCFHPDGKHVAAGDLKAVVRAWDVESGAAAKEFAVAGLFKLNHMQECGGVRRLCFDAAGKQLICGGQKDPEGGFATGSPTVVALDWENGQVVRQVVAGENQDGFIYDVQVHPDGFVMATASAFPGKGKLFFWQTSDEKPFLISPKHSNGRSVSLHPDKRRLAFLMSDSTNGNGRSLGKDGEYFGGRARIHLLTLPEPAAT